MRKHYKTKVKLIIGLPAPSLVELTQPTNYEKTL